MNKRYVLIDRYNSLSKLCIVKLVVIAVTVSPRASEKNQPVSNGLTNDKNQDARSSGPTNDEGEDVFRFTTI